MRVTMGVFVSHCMYFWTCQNTAETYNYGGCKFVLLLLSRNWFGIASFGKDSKHSSVERG